MLAPLVATHVVPLSNAIIALRLRSLDAVWHVSWEVAYPQAGGSGPWKGTFHLENLPLDQVQEAALSHIHSVMMSFADEGNRSVGGYVIAWQDCGKFFKQFHVRSNP